ncbi:hypothetical protein Tco_1409343 [Tanacetum coccineum]
MLNANLEPSFGSSFHPILLPLTFTTNTTINIYNELVLYFISDDVPAIPAIPIPAIPAPHRDDVIIILSDEEYSSDKEYSSDEEYSSDDEKDDIPEDDVVPTVPVVLVVPIVPTIPAPNSDDVVVISSDEEPEMPAKKVSVKRRKRVFALVDESDSDEECWSNVFLF